MFGLFKKKNFQFDCPMCGRTYNIKFDPSEITDFDYPYWKDAGEVGGDSCGFCKTEMVFAFSKDGEMRAFDEKWEIVQQAHYDNLEPIESEIMDIEADLEEEHPGDVTLLKKLKQLESRQEKLENAFEKKEMKYYDRQERWSEKWQDKLSRM